MEWTDEDERRADAELRKYGFCRRWLSAVSNQALEREEQVKALFHQAKKEFERTMLASLPMGEKHVIQDCVPPKYHLTAYTWKTFRTWVEELHPGWKAKRRLASKEELELYREEEGNKLPSRGKSYYVSFIYQDPSTVKKRNNKKNHSDDAHEESQKPPAKKLKAAPSPPNQCNGSVKNDEVEESQKPPAKKVGSLNFDNLPEHVQLHVLSYCDVPTLGAIVPVSKSLCHLAKEDRLWEPHLRHLLRVLFDGSMENNPATPLSERTDWRQSTALLRWWQALDWKAQSYVGRKGDFLSIASRYAIRELSRRKNPQRHQERRSDGMDERFAFLLNDVPLREYYHLTGSFAFRSALGENFTTCEPQEKYCPECFFKARQPTEFANLPKIMWCA